jgi:integrase
MNRNEIRVHVSGWGRKNLMMRYRDPVTGKRIARSAETTNRKQAEKSAAKWEAELQEGRYKSPLRVTWIEFRHRYEDEVLPSLADNTAGKVFATFNAVERHVDPMLLSAVTAETVSTLQSKLREAGLADSTIKGHMAHLLASLNWAKDVGMIYDVPKVRMPQRAKKSRKESPMKGRPITGEEFERMLAKAPDKSWQHLLRGLWLSGLRLGEALELWWDRDDKLTVDLSGRHTMLRIRAELEKGHEDRMLPIAPEFIEFLLATPEAERTGPVFNPRAQRKRSPRLGIGRVGKAISEIGEKAGVKVLTDRNGKVKFASAHDLRRSFGDRWATRVMPIVLKELMRHESIETTLRYYVGLNAESTVDALYRAVGNTSGNSTLNGGPIARRDEVETPIEIST